MATSNDVNADEPQTPRDGDAADAADGDITIYAMPGSQYCTKVLAALDSRRIPHCCVFVDADPARRKLPSGGRMVPEMTVGPSPSEDGRGTPTVVPDSERILHWLSDHHRKCPTFFPTESASQASTRASDGILAGAVLYYNWVDDEGYSRSMRKNFAKRYVLPGVVLVPDLFRTAVADYYLRPARDDFRAKVGASSPELKAAMDDRGKVYNLLVEELSYFQSLLLEEVDGRHDDKRGPYLLSGSSQIPTAADFSVYAQLERLVGDTGDVNVPPSLPELREGEGTGLGRLWEWHRHMRENHPIRYKGKRPSSKQPES